MKKTSLILGLMSVMCLVGCGGTENSGNTSVSTSSSSDSSLVNVGDGYGQISTADLPVHYSQVRASSFLKESSPDVPSTGDVKGLVIPVQFRDKTCSSMTAYGGCEGLRADMQKTLFGDGSGTNWESLASYYKKSSYGKLNLTGEVADWYTPKMTASQFGESYGSNGGGGAVIMLNEAIADYKSKHDAEHMKQFDSNGDGHLDAVWLIYTVDPHWNGYNDLYWAFVYWNQGSTANVENPTPYSFMWASYNFMYENAVTDTDGTVLPDAHTFIHETGHLLGLSDYYNYDDGDHGSWGPCGGLDMMDYNIGDHNSYSKSVLEWVEPYVVLDDASITIRPFESSGDCIIVAPEGYKNSILDEYLIIEYYTPTGLNQYDSENRYAGSYPLLFTESGVKVYHVDSRIGGFREGQSSYVFGRYVDTMEEAWRFRYVDVVAENSPSRSNNPDPDAKLIHLLEPSGENTFINGARASNSSLFKTGDTFGVSGGPFAGFKYHKEVSSAQLGLQFSFEIGAMTAEGVTISFTKL